MVPRVDGSYKDYCATKILSQGDCFEREASFFLLIVNNYSHLTPMFTNIKPNPDLMRNKNVQNIFIHVFIYPVLFTPMQAVIYM